MKPFDPKDWVPKAQPISQKGTAPMGDNAEAVELALQAIEDSGIDLTSSYGVWRDIGFAFADEFGENGRYMYHRVSRYHPDYEAKACDRQYDRCLKSGGTGIGLGTFFFHLRQANLNWQSPQDQPASGQQNASLGAAGKPANGEREFALPGDHGNGAFWEEEGAGVLGQGQKPALYTEEEVFEQERDLAAASVQFQASLSPITNGLPVFPEAIYELLPPFLQQVVRPAETSEDRDVILLGALTVLSSALPNIFGIYDRKRVYPNLFLFVTAPASGGKGQLGFTKHLVMPIHLALREQSKQDRERYEIELAAANSSKENTEKPKRPGERMLLFPGNSSATGMLQLLGENDCKGLIFETEGDTMAMAFKNDYSNYSDSFRKAFHHETISFFRRTENEYVNLEEPMLSALLSGTPRQIKNVVQDAENGLFSRFVFYSMNMKLVWKDVFATSDQHGLERYFLNLGMEFARFHHSLATKQPLRIELTAAQQQRFHRFFQGLQHKYLQLQPEEFVATIRRMGLSAFRFMMCLSSIRLMEEGCRESRWVCRDADFEVALQMAEVLLRHSSHVFYRLPAAPALQLRNDRQEWLLNNLPEHFDFRMAQELGEQRGITRSTLERDLRAFLAAGLLKKPQHNTYEQIVAGGEPEGPAFGEAAPSGSEGATE